MEIEPILVADIGGTNARFGVALADNRGLRIEHARQLPCAAFENFESAFENYRQGLNGSSIRRACVAAAGPVTQENVSFTNLDWRISSADIQHRFDLDRFEVVNDFAALAAAVPHLRPDALTEICSGSRKPGAPVAIVGPGTGLGVAALIPDGDDWSELASEGGHASLASTGPLEAKIISSIGGGAGVSAETLLSGRGILRIYESVCALEQCRPVLSSSEEVTQAALERSDEQAVSAVEVFCRLLGGVAGDLVLTFGALGGLYLAGGILPSIENLLRSSGFEACLKDKGVMKHYLKTVNVSLITSVDAGMIGAAAWMAAR